MDTSEVSITHLADLPLYRWEKPYELWRKVDFDLPKTNCKFVEEKVSLRAARTPSSKVGLETTGFEWLWHESKHLPKPDFELLDGDQILRPYLEETQRLCMDLFGAEQVVITDWTVGVLSVSMALSYCVTRRAHSVSAS